MELENISSGGAGVLKVNYSESLVTLVKDSRAIGEHGFTIDPLIQDIVENAKKFYKEGVALKQVANFYNQMSTQVIECQMPMIQQQVMEFDRFISDNV